MTLDNTKPYSQHSEPAEIRQPTDHSHQSSVAQSLWRDAYEHPWRDGAAAVGVIAALGLAIASRGKLQELISPTEVLLLEDEGPWGRSYQYALQAQGKKVTWLTGVTSLSPFMGTTESGQIVAPNLSRFKAAFIDGDLGPDSLKGEQVVGALPEKIVKLGISTLPENMLANGAQIAANKVVVFSFLANQKLELAAAAKRPADLQQELNALQKVLRTPAYASYKKNADDIYNRLKKD